MMIDRYKYHILIAVISGLVLSINFDWGLPNQNRLDLLGGQSFIQNSLPEINAAKNTAKAIGTDNLEPDARILFSLREFLISPFAGDDNFTLNAIRQLNPYKLKFDPKFYMYGGGLIYSGATFVQISAWLGYTKLIPNADFYLTHPQELGKIFRVLRFMIVILAIMSVVISYHLAKSYTTHTTALSSTAILLITPVIHQASRAIEPHVFVVPFFLLAFFYIIDFAQHHRQRALFLAALFSGISVGIQAISIYIGIVFLVALFIKHRNTASHTSKTIRCILIYGFIAALTGLALNPYYVINFDGFMQDLSRGTGNQVLNNIKPWAPGQLSIFLLILFLITPCYHVIKPNKNAFIKLALTCTLTAVPVYIFICNYHMPYVLTAMPLYAILTAMMLQDIYTQRSANYRRYFLILLIILFAIFPAARSLYYITNFTSENREQAGAWVNDQIPRQATVAIRFPPSIWDCVPFEFTQYNLIDYRKITPSTLPDYAVLLNVELPESLLDHFKLVKVFGPTPILGTHFELTGELHALIGKTIRIYKRIPTPMY